MAAEPGHEPRRPATGAGESRAEGGGPAPLVPGRASGRRGPIDPRLLRHARCSRAGIASLALLGTGQAVSTVLVAVALTLLVASPRWWALGLLAGAYGLRAVLSWGEQVVAVRTAARVTDELRRRMLAALPRRGPAWVADFGSGRLTALLTNGLDALRPWFGGYLPSLILGVALPPLVVVTMAVVDPASALIAVATLPLIPVLGALIGWATQAQARHRWQADARLAGHFLDVVQGLPTLRVFGRATRQTTVIAGLTDQHRRATLRVLRVAFLSSTALDLVGTLSVGLIAVEAGLRVAAGHLPLAPALLVILLAPEAYRPLREMAARYHAATDATAVITDVDEVLAPISPAPATPPGHAELSADTPRSATATGIRPTSPEPTPSGDVGQSAHKSHSANDATTATGIRPVSPTAIISPGHVGHSARIPRSANDAITASGIRPIPPTPTTPSDDSGHSAHTSRSANQLTTATGIPPVSPTAIVTSDDVGHSARTTRSANDVAIATGIPPIPPTTSRGHVEHSADTPRSANGAAAAGGYGSSSPAPASRPGRPGLTAGERSVDERSVDDQAAGEPAHSPVRLPATAGVLPLPGQAGHIASRPRPGRPAGAGTLRSGSPAPGARQGRVGVAVDGLRARYAGGTADALFLPVLAVAPGEIVALRGTSGAGKTTALRVLAGLHPASGGSVRVGDPLYLPQRPTLPHARTVADLFPGADATEPLATVGLARELTPDTPLGERGTGVSAGQRHRLALAALLHKAGHAPATLLLDEPTAHLDPDTERLVIARLREAADAGSAILVVAHRPALLAAADRIVDLTAPHATPVGPPTTSAVSVPDSMAAPDAFSPKQDSELPGLARPSSGAGTPSTVTPAGSASRAESTGAAAAARTPADAYPGDAHPGDVTRSAATVGREMMSRAVVPPGSGVDDVESSEPATSAETPAAASATTGARRWFRSWPAAVALGSGSSLAGVLLTGAAAWLLVRAATLPPVLTLSAAVVLVRGSAVARPLLRYVERLVAHDVAFSRLGARRARVYAALVPRTPGPRLRRRGDLLARVVDDVDARVDGLLRGRLPALTAAVTLAVATIVVVAVAPAVAIPLAVGLVVAGVVAPARAGRQAAREDAATAAARSRLRDAMVETVDGIEELGSGSRVPEKRSRSLARLESRAARAAGQATAIAHLGWGVAVTGAAWALTHAAALPPEWTAVILLAVVALGEPVLTLPDAATARRRDAGAAARLAELTSAPTPATFPSPAGAGTARPTPTGAGIVRPTPANTGTPRPTTTGASTTPRTPANTGTARPTTTVVGTARPAPAAPADLAAAGRDDATPLRLAETGGPAPSETGGGTPALETRADGRVIGSLSLRGVDAGWDPERAPVLRGFDLELPTGARVAVLGRSGSGKSTLGAVVARLLDPRGGSITAGGRDLGALPEEQVRGRIVLVGDETGHVFASSVRENLRLARPEAGDDELRAVLERVRLGEWLDGLAYGLGTWLGAGGATMSGGQARRLATARALLAEPEVLILDEPTEGLDADLAEALMADLLDAAAGRTVLLLTHRTEGLDQVDRVLRLPELTA